MWLTTRGFGTAETARDITAAGPVQLSGRADELSGNPERRTMTERILAVWLVLASGVQLGTLWIMKTSILPMLNGLAYDRYVNVCQLIDMHVFHPIALWNGIIGAGMGIALAVLAPNPASTVLFVVGALSMAAVGAASEGVNRPIWRQIERWSPHRVKDADWAVKRRRWHMAHQVRTYSAVGALCCYAAAAAVIATV
jgi:uncharacterized membrane protein